MLIENTAYKVVSNVDNKKTTFGISNVSKVIELLISQYEKPLQTIPQEYISNAIDATREANSSEKVKVELPNAFNKGMLKIRDYGIGLNKDRLEKVFVNMGATTKDTSNGQIGGFGIGAKSYLKYDDHFHIVTFLNGIKSEYIVRKDESGIVLEELGESSTDEKNGTLILLPFKAQDYSTIKQSCYRVQAFMSDYVEIKDNEPLLLGKGIQLSERVKIYHHKELPMFNSYELSKIVLLVGGVPYTLNNRVVTEYKLPVNRINSDYSMFISLDIKDIMPIQTRENIDTSANITKLTLAKIAKKLPSVIDSYIEEKLDVKGINNFIQALNNVKGLYIDDNTIKEKGKIDFCSVFGNTVTFNRKVKVIKYTKQSKMYSRRKVKTMRLEHITYIYHNDLKNLYIKDINESDHDTAKRLRLATDNDDILILKPVNGFNREFKKAVKWFKPKSIRTLTMPEKQIVTRSPSVSRPRGEITLRTTGGSVVTNINLETNTNKFYYVERDHFNVEYINILKNVNKMNIYSIAKSHIKKVENDPNFVLVNEDFKLDITKDDIFGLACQKLNNYARTSTFFSNNLNKLIRDRRTVDFKIEKYFDNDHKKVYKKMLKKVYKLKNLNYKSKYTGSSKHFKEYLRYYKGIDI